MTSWIQALLLGFALVLAQAVENPYMGVSYTTQAVGSPQGHSPQGTAYANAVAQRAQPVAYAPMAALLNQAAGRALAAGPAYQTATLPFLAAGPAYMRTLPPILNYGGNQYLMTPQLVHQAGVAGLVAPAYAHGAARLQAAPQYAYGAGQARLVAASPAYATGAAQGVYGASRAVHSLGLQGLQTYALPAAGHGAAAAGPAYAYGGQTRLVAMPYVSRDKRITKSKRMGKV
ncbi:cuticle protein, putative [Ixodes scapularis]|uniref:Cuticle protein, putative n=1 Tax=Ixodes scapularis TaxID=6945 RepID=B7P4Q5_IXOSC|nr:cuticle protein, putative [Ixodes scapularis]|eukprot:XP_002406350.1 cuticle protein, putative [Ixodes scapularis]